MMTKDDRILVCGLGSIGRRHLSNLRAMLPEAKLTVWRQHGRNTGVSDLPDERVNVVYSFEKAVESRPQAALICNPAPFHVPTAQALAQRGVHIFMEKPISDRLEGIDELVETCADGGLVLFVAYPLRFDAALIALRDELVAGAIGDPISIDVRVGQYLPDWREGQDYRTGVSARKELGGGVLLELSHELDYARWLLGEVSSVSATLARISDLDIDVEDTANLTLEFANNVTGQVHLDMISRIPERMCVVVGSRGKLEWDGMSRTSRILIDEIGEWRELSSGSRQNNDMFVDELGHFLECIASKRVPESTGTDGKRILEIILAARESSESGSIVRVPNRF